MFAKLGIAKCVKTVALAAAAAAVLARASYAQVSGTDPQVVLLTATPVPGGAVRVEGVVANLGLADFHGPAEVQLYRDGELVQYQSFQTLRPGEQIVLSVDGPLFPGVTATFTLMIVYDPDILIDGNPQNDDVNWDNNRREVVVQQPETSPPWWEDPNPGPNPWFPEPPDGDDDRQQFGAGAYGDYGFGQFGGGGQPGWNFAGPQPEPPRAMDGQGSETPSGVVVCPDHGPISAGPQPEPPRARPDPSVRSHDDTIHRNRGGRAAGPQRERPRAMRGHGPTFAGPQPQPPRARGRQGGNPRAFDSLRPDPNSARQHGTSRRGRMGRHR